MNRRETLIAMLVTVSLASASLSPFSRAQESQEPTTPPCADDAHRQLDFWVGEWELSWDNGDGTTGTGSNTITRDEYGDCVIYERFRSDAFIGMSVSTYFAPAGVWRQTWVDDTGGYFALTGGPSHEDGVHFELRNTRLNETELHLRMVWEDVSPSRLVWRWQSLPPDANPDTDEWQDRWVINYNRVE